MSSPPMSFERMSTRSSEVAIRGRSDLVGSELLPRNTTWPPAKSKSPAASPPARSYLRRPPVDLNPPILAKQPLSPIGGDQATDCLSAKIALFTIGEEHLLVEDNQSRYF
ncbi:hypothetical protein FA95DRAFT_1614068 [Auriscalpium vulgare]|uniref:Uncharacterized protein n=1 Tax=Auriscalpium vulgare TaxID=40419 RepID=A0ACB8R0D0_9AGAM|nr:hypothetical protein FA95DRAFT_1614068 [Auriscalpium vulgare]